MILGISGSPRPDGITGHAVKDILSKVQGETEFISLNGKRINGCISCLGCAKDNRCVVEDDFIDIAEKMVEAKAIVIGVPNYYNMPNALTHSLLERCFCFRHQGAFALRDKPIIILSTGYSKDEENSQVLKLVEYFALSNKMKVSSKFLVDGFSQCYTCPFGHSCADGNVFHKYGFVEAITPDMLPDNYEEQTLSQEKCFMAAEQLNQIISEK